MQQPRTGPLLCALALGTVAFAARADVTIAETFRVEAMGAIAHLSAEGTVTTTVADRRGRIDSQTLTQSESMQQYAGAGSHTTLVLLDEQRLLRLGASGSEPENLRFEELRARLDYGRAALDEADAAAEMVDLPVAEEECQWSGAETEQRSTGLRAEIGGVEATQHFITVRQVCSVGVSAQHCALGWNLERWTADKLPGGKELQAFGDEFYQAMGGVDLLSAAELNDSGLLALFRHGWVRSQEAARALPGYPVKTVMSMDIGGVDCTTGDGTPLAYDSDWHVVEEIARETGRNSAKSMASNTVASTVVRNVGVGGLGGMIAGTVASEMTRRAIDRMARQKEEEQAVPEEDLHVVDPDADAILLFKISTELAAASRERVDEEVFQLPVPQ